MRTGAIDWGAASLTLPGEPECGDRYVVAPTKAGVLVGVVDGVGHGREAAFAAEKATLSIRKFAHEEPLPALVQRCHVSLSGTRGTVMSLAQFNSGQTMIWMGVGDVEGRLIRMISGARRQKSLLLRPGVVGTELPTLYTSSVAVLRNDLLILATDGVDRNFAEAVDLDDEPQRISETIIANHSKGSDDALVFVARYLG
jgi:serine/threonine protein phosphatase PrpC